MTPLYPHAGTSTQLDAEVLEMPYHSGNASLFVLLPRHRHTGLELDSLISRLNSQRLTSALANITSAPVHLQLPKFSVETHLRHEFLQVSLGRALACECLLMSNTYFAP